MKDFERLLMFFYILRHGCQNEKDQLKKFRQISGLNELETQVALDELVIRGFIDKEGFVT